MYLPGQQHWMQCADLIYLMEVVVLPPRWGLGFTQRVRSLFTADEVKKEAMLLRKKDIRLDFIGLEPGGKANLIPVLLNGIKNVFLNLQNL